MIVISISYYAPQFPEDGDFDIDVVDRSAPSPRRANDARLHEPARPAFVGIRLVGRVKKESEEPVAVDGPYFDMSAEVAEDTFSALHWSRLARINNEIDMVRSAVGVGPTLEQALARLAAVVGAREFVVPASLKNDDTLRFAPGDPGIVARLRVLSDEWRGGASI